MINVQHYVETQQVSLKLLCLQMSNLIGQIVSVNIKIIRLAYTHYYEKMCTYPIWMAAI
jgi:hypothetical protein